MGKKKITIYIRGGAKIGDQRRIINRETGEEQVFTVIEDLINSIPARKTFNNKTINPAKHYYRLKN